MMTMSGKPTIIFDALNNILCKKSDALFMQHVNDEELWKTWSKFMVLRYLTMSTNPAVRDVVINRYLRLERMPDAALYKWLLRNIPKQSSGFIRYLK